MLIGTVLSLLVLFVASRLENVPRSVPVLFAIAQFLLLAGPRMAYRWYKDRRLDLSSGKRALIVVPDGRGRC